MDSSTFDRLARSMAAPASRRRALGMITAGGLLGGLTRGRSVAAQGTTCTYNFLSTVRLGPSSQQVLVNDGSQPGSVPGALSFSLSPEGALENGSLVLTDGTALPVVGQATGNSLNMRVDVGQGLVFVFVGVGEQAVAACQGAISGITSGPQAGDLGDWQAVASGQATSQTGSVSAAAQGSGQPATAENPSRVLVSSGSGSSGSGGTANPPPATGATGPAATCPAGQIDCGGTCINPAEDDVNCGRCGNRCPTGQNCVGGACAPLGGGGESPCAAGQTECAGVCVDTSSDPDNCGTCGTLCPVVPSLFECIAGVCTPPDCGEGMTDCSGLCVNLQTDPLHCGVCGTSCEDGETCAGGECVTLGGGGCVSPLTQCITGPGPQDFQCVNIQADTAHCGGCGQPCAPNSTCQGGQCFANQPVTCNPGLENCFGTCVDTTNSAQNCGACGVPCPEGQLCQSRVCVAGGPACESPLVACGGICLNTQNDPFACGSCTNVCGEGQTCQGGTCV